MFLIKKIFKRKHNCLAGTELTSWETYNYILYGFVNELVQLGCKDEVTLTVLQLWSAYLRMNEVAFFGKRETNLPKFSFKHSPRCEYFENISIKRHSNLFYFQPFQRCKTDLQLTKSQTKANNLGGKFVWN